MLLLMWFGSRLLLACLGPSSGSAYPTFFLGSFAPRWLLVLPVRSGLSQVAGCLLVLRENGGGGLGAAVGSLVSPVSFFAFFVSLRFGPESLCSGPL